MNQRQDIDQYADRLVILDPHHKLSWRKDITGWAELTLSGNCITLTECPARGSRRTTALTLELRSARELYEQLRELLDQSEPVAA